MKVKVYRVRSLEHGVELVFLEFFIHIKRWWIFLKMVLKGY